MKVWDTIIAEFKREFGKLYIIWMILVLAMLGVSSFAWWIVIREFI